MKSEKAVSSGRLGDAAGRQAYGQVASDGEQSLHQHPSPNLPMSTEKKNCTMGMFRIGADRFKNQFGVMGKSLRNSRKKNRLFLFSSTCRESPPSGAEGLSS